MEPSGPIQRFLCRLNKSVNMLTLVPGLNLGEIKNMKMCGHQLLLE